jgi:hypothetical protein
MWWWLGELVNYSHVLFMGGVMLAGFLWLRPIWLQVVILACVVPAQEVFGNCPFTVLANWLQSRQSPSMFDSFLEIYGLIGTKILMISLGILGIVLAYLASRITRGPLVWPGAVDDNLKKNFWESLGNTEGTQQPKRVSRNTGMPI